VASLKDCLVDYIDAGGTVRICSLRALDAADAEAKMRGRGFLVIEGSGRARNDAKPLAGYVQETKPAGTEMELA
jgi:hypothetical protein